MIFEGSGLEIRHFWHFRFIACWTDGRPSIRGKKAPAKIASGLRCQCC
ncbi:hypothetical protein PCLA_13f0237 [Pseudomonas citronellolis]|nr:hypothetical protein PCLA_13f0237 [Pseudomonas citronellolis]